VAVNVVLLLFNDIEANLVVSECALCYRVVANEILCDYFCYILYPGRECFNTVNTG